MDTAAALSEERLVRRLTPAIRLFAVRHVRAVDTQDEFVHDVLVQLIEAFRTGKLGQAERPHAYALAVCRNLAMSRQRAHQRRASLWERYGEREEPATEAGLTAEFSRADVEDCLSQLTRRARVVLHRAFVLGETNGEIGDALQVREGNVRVIRHRALGQLRECLDGAQEGGAQ